MSKVRDELRAKYPHYEYPLWVDVSVYHWIKTGSDRPEHIAAAPSELLATEKGRRTWAMRETKRWREHFGAKTVAEAKALPRPTGGELARLMRECKPSGEPAA